MGKQLQCWSRKGKKGSYVVCTGSRGQARRSKRLRKKARSKSNKQRGGMSPFVGGNWSSQPATWPGVGGVDGVTNHYKLNENVVPLPASSSQTGGKKLKCWSRKSKKGSYVVCTGSRGQVRRSKRLRKKKRSKSKKQRGGNKGAPLSQTLVNMGRSLSYGGESLFNGVQGYNAPVNPSPENQSALFQDNGPDMNHSKISDIYTQAQNQVGAL